MGRTRRARRRHQRERAKQTSQAHRVSAPARVGFAVLGLLLLGSGIFLLAGASVGTAQRLGRLAGILMIIGCVLVGVGAVGRF